MKKEKGCPRIWHEGPSTCVILGTTPCHHPSLTQNEFPEASDWRQSVLLKAGEEELEDPHAVVSGTLLVNDLFTRVLFDASHSFINPVTTERLACKLGNIDVQLCVTTGLGSIY